MATYNINVNGQNHTVVADEDTPILWVLRDNLRLVGTKYGCGIAQCGACTIHIAGVATRACVTPISAIGNKAVTTIEGLSPTASHPLQQAWVAYDVPQCGYCQAGQLMTAAALLKSNSKPTDDEISEAMNGNICRCGTYNRIHDAIKHAAKNA